MDATICERNDLAGYARKILIAVIFLPCFFAFWGELDNDIWFLLNHGKTVFVNGFPDVDPYTIHSGFKFVMQQWFSAVIFYTVYSALGEIGLKILVFVFHAIIVALFYRLSMRLSEGYFFISYAISLAFSVLIGFFMVERPYIFTSLVIIIEIWILEKYADEKNPKTLYVLPILSLILVNLQAAIWPMLFVLMLPYLFDSFKFSIGKICGSDYPWKPLTIAAIFMLLFGFVNPYGINAMTYLINSYGVPEINALVGEMHYLTIENTLGKIIIFVIFIVFLSFSLNHTSKIKLRYILLALGTAYLTLSAYRGFQFFVICGLLPLPYLFRNVKIPVYANNFPRRTRFIRAALFVIIIFEVSFLSYKYYTNSQKSTSNANQLTEIVAQIQADQRVGKVVVYTGYDDGPFVEYNKIPVYLDTRAEVFIKKNNLKEDVLMEYYNLQTGRLYYKTVLDKYKFTHIIVSESDILYTYLPYDVEYKLIYENDSYRLYRRI